MVNRAVIFFCLLFINLGFAQDYIIIDSIEKEPLPYSTIIYDNSGMYSNEEGEFSINNTVGKNLIIKHLGYKDFVFNPSEINIDTIKMVQDRVELEEVVLQNLGQEIKIDFLKQAKSIGYFPIGYHNELVINMIPNEGVANSIVKSVCFSFENNIKNKEFSIFEGTLRINVYDNAKRIFSSDPIEMDNKFMREIKVELPRNKIQFFKNGIGFGIEILENSASFDKNYLYPILTKQRHRQYSAITYLKNVFSDKEKLIPINEILNNTSSKKDYKRNLSISLVLLKKKQ